MTCNNKDKHNDTIKDKEIIRSFCNYSFLYGQRKWKRIKKNEYVLVACIDACNKFTLIISCATSKMCYAVVLIRNNVLFVHLVLSQGLAAWANVIFHLDLDVKRFPNKFIAASPSQLCTVSNPWRGSTEGLSKISLL